jgi:L-alanine-DL-glutamate epimerase-like enolase superfamily enzyme
VETAVLDAWARLKHVPLSVLLGGEQALATHDITTDITIPIGAPEHMGQLAGEWWRKGFRQFKVKVGRGVEADIAALEAIHERAPEAIFRLDANAGYSATEAIAVARSALDAGLRIECYEQPCGRLALDALREVAASLGVPVIADESVATLDELSRVIAARAVQGVNLKLVKSGGPLRALAIGRAAREAGLSLMVGAMVETRLGISAAAHVTAALGGVEYPDLDTALLLAGDPFVGGYTMTGPRLTLGDAPGLGVDRR